MESLIRRARWNSALLAFLFLSNGISAAHNGNVVLMLLFMLVVGFTVMDVFKFSEALDILKKSEKEHEDEQG